MARRKIAVFHKYSSDSNVNQILHRRTRKVLKKQYQTVCVERHRLNSLVLLLAETLPQSFESSDQAETKSFKGHSCLSISFVVRTTAGHD